MSDKLTAYTLHLFRTLLEAVNAISTATPSLDTLETQYVQSFYDTTYRAHMIRCLVQALTSHGNMPGWCADSDTGSDDDDCGLPDSKDNAAADNVAALKFVDNCVFVFSELVLTSSKFMKQVGTCGAFLFFRCI